MASGELKFKIEDNILAGEEIPYDNEYASLGEFVLDRLQKNPKIVGQIDTSTGEKYSYKKMRERSIKCALWMKTQGLLPGDVITICSHNQHDYTMACFASLYLAAAFQPLDVSLNDKELSHMMNITKPKIAFANKKLAPSIANAAKKLNLDIKVIVFGKIDGYISFENIIAEAKIEDVDKFKPVELKNQEVTAFVMGTSGTTGAPKGVALSHRSVLRQMRQTKILGMEEKVCVIFTTPAWITGTLCVFMTLYSKIPRLIAPSFEEFSACEIIEKYKVEWVIFAPNMINRILKSGALEKYDISSLKYVLCGGSMLSPNSEKAFSAYLSNGRVIICFGTTESGGFLSRQFEKSTPGSCGRLIENVKLKVIDLATGDTLGPNEQGEVLVKSATIMNGYYNDPQNTAATVDEEGWIHTGDIGYYDENGEVYLIDRLKEMIKYRGYHISPSDIETVILTHPGVEEVAVVGLPHPQDDEHPIAFVVKNKYHVMKGKEVTEKELIDLVATEMSDSKQLRGGVQFVDSIPKTSSNKFQRKILREWAKTR